MWDEFVAKLAFAAPTDGAPLFCDSCHQGRVEQLDRRDKKALGRGVDDNFVAELKQKNGGPQEGGTSPGGKERQPLNLWAGAPGRQAPPPGPPLFGRQKERSRT